MKKTKNQRSSEKLPFVSETLRVLTLSRRQLERVAGGGDRTRDDTGASVAGGTTIVEPTSMTCSR